MQLNHNEVGSKHSLYGWKRDSVNIAKYDVEGLSKEFFSRSACRRSLSRWKGLYRVKDEVYKIFAVIVNDEHRSGGLGPFCTSESDVNLSAAIS